MNCKKNNKKSSGFTLVETLIYIAFIGMVIVDFVIFAMSISNAKGKAYVEQEVQANVRIAMDVMAREIKQAEFINTTSSVFATDPGVLSFETGLSTTTPTVFSLDADDGVLRIMQGSSTPVVITSDEVRITNLVFTNLTATSSKEHIKIELTAEYLEIDSVVYKYTHQIQTGVSLRK